MRIDIMTLFPEMCEAVFCESITGRARLAGLIDIEAWQIRDYTIDKHRRTDFPPYGGGTGMLMQADPIYNCYDAICSETGGKPHVIYMSAQGAVLTQKRALELSGLRHIAILCGHYEGVDERVIEEIVDEEISVGDYVLTGGELPALVLTDCIARMIPGVLATDESYMGESHFNGLLEYPQYTKPAVWHNREVPEVLRSGHHANIENWQKEQAEKRTELRRPDLMKRRKTSLEG